MDRRTPLQTDPAAFQKLSKSFTRLLGFAVLRITAAPTRRLKQEYQHRILFEFLEIVPNRPKLQTRQL